jgi:predicted DCC family thiol-disulfide oxidoreductase YuxK
MTEAERAAIHDRHLLLFDGVCALCNNFVRFLIDRDKLARLRFAPLESPLGREVLAHFNIHSNPDGVVFITNTLTPAEHLYRRSDAALHALQLTEGPWPRLARAAAILPRPLREFGYTLVARLRFSVFGRYSTCPLPPPEQRSRILGVYE